MFVPILRLDPACRDRKLLALASLVWLVAISSSARSGEIVFKPDVEFSNPDGEHLKLDLAYPQAESAKLRPAVICIHGGGFRSGDKNRWDALCKTLAKRGYVAISVNYRLSPKYQFPAAVFDVKAAVRWLRANADKYRLDPDRIGAVGDSAGGHLVLFLGATGGVQQFEGHGGHGDKSSRVQCVVCYYGPSDFTKSYGKSVDAHIVLPMFFGGDLAHARHQHILGSPLNWVTPEAPPTLLIHGTQDQYVAYEQAQWMHQRLQAAGVPVELLTMEGAKHGFGGADAKRAEAATLAFLDLHLQP